jgi:hypothetical protein
MLQKEPEREQRATRRVVAIGRIQHDPAVLQQRAELFARDGGIAPKAGL